MMLKDAKDRKQAAITIVAAMPKPSREDDSLLAKADAMKAFSQALGIELDDDKAKAAAMAFQQAYELCDESEGDSEMTEEETGPDKYA